MTQTPPAPPTVSFAAAVNDQAVLDLCLARSPDIVSGRSQLRTYRGFKTAGAAYNAALAETDADYVVLVHQDVYLPTGSVDRLIGALHQIEADDPNWGVAGVIGLDAEKRLQGQTWSSGIGGMIGRAITAPAAVEALDEMVLVVRGAAGLRFDEQLPGFHLYGADIIQIARTQGMSSYAIPLPVVHHSRPTVLLAADYRRCYRYMTRKWRSRLPINGLICTLSANPAVLWLADFGIRRANRFDPHRAEPKGDPAQIGEQII
jgi:hypothetical protein